MQSNRKETADSVTLTHYPKIPNKDLSAREKNPELLSNSSCDEGQSLTISQNFFF